MTEPSKELAAVAQVERDTWERCADEYVNGFGALVCQTIPFLLDAASIAKGMHVLDVGSGPGTVAAAVRDRGATAIGIDYAEAMVRQARNNHPDIQFHVGSADSLPFEAEEFDAVVSNFVLHHLAYPDKALREVHRVLRPGKRAAFTVWADREKLEGFAMFFEAFGAHVDLEQMPSSPLHGVTDYAALDAVMREAGFRETAVTEVAIEWRIESIDAFLSAFRKWANLDEMPENVGLSIETSVRQRAEALRKNTGLVFSNPAILVSGAK